MGSHGRRGGVSGWQVVTAGVLALASGLPASADWVDFVDETATRLAGPDPGVVRDDPDEKDYGVGDFDQDGDLDLVVVRKEPFLTAGKRTNVLLINEDGVLTDRTAEFAVASTFGLDSGFLTPTNDRDVKVVDVDLDGWLDLVTAATISPGEPKFIGHPRVYRNLGCTGACNGTSDWLGFRHEESRIPTMSSWTGQTGFNPCLCHVDAGDVTGDGYPDLWLVDYDLSCDAPGADFNSRLLINQGAANPGYFTDETATRFAGTVGGQPFPVNENSLAGYVVDMNDDDLPDLVLESAGVVDIAYNDPTNPGFFSSYSSPAAHDTYFMNVADLNQDGLPDLFSTDDGADRYYLNQGPDLDGKVDFVSYVYSFQHTGIGGAASDDGFGDDTYAVDLNRDGWLDVLTADVDFEFIGCERRAHIYRNLGGTPGGTPVLEEQSSGAGCQNFLGNPASCVVAGLGADRLVGTSDIAAFDINGDDWPDLVIGRCNGTQVYINQPSAGGAGSLPDGDGVAGAMLELAKGPGSLIMSWGESCVLDDTDYAIYSGPIGDFSSHTEVTCTTNGSAGETIPTASGDRYYLVVAHNGTFEGGYGFTGAGTLRTQGASACRAQLTETCE